MKPHRLVASNNGHLINTAVKIGTTYSPEALLEVIHQIESGLHRTRKIHWDPNR